MRTIRSVNNELGSYKIIKDKRYLLHNGIESYAHGHYKIEQ